MSQSNRGENTLFNRAYVGLKVIIESDDFASYVCIDAGPYTPGSHDEVKSSNWNNYWQKADKDAFDYIENNVDASILDISKFAHLLETSVNLLDEYAKTNIIPDSNNGLTISHILGDIGNIYSIEINTDSSTVAIINDELVGGTYKIVKDVANDLDDSNLYARYNLVYRQPGSSTDVPVGGSETIDIPKIQVLKDASICKAELDASAPGGYRVTSYQTDSSWGTDEHNVFICIAWDVSNGNSDNLIGNSDGLTYIDIDDLFERNFENIESSLYDISVRFREEDASIINYVNIGLEGLNNRVDSVDVSINGLNTNLNDLSTRINEEYAKIDYVNTGLEGLSNRVDSVDVSVNGLNTNLNDLSTRISEIIDVSTSIVDLSTRINKIDTSINHLYDRLNIVDSEIDTIDTNIYRINASLNSINTSVNKINSSVNAINSNVIAINGRVNTIDTNITRINTSVNAINTSVNKINSSLNAINSSVNAINSSVIAINGRVNIIDASINYINDYVNDNLEEVRRNIR